MRNFLRASTSRDGDVAIALQGTSARDRALHCAGRQRHGCGSKATRAFDDAPTARSCTLSADKFEVLGRVDRRIVASGRAALRLDATTLGARRRLQRSTKGLVDFTRSRRADARRAMSRSCAGRASLAPPAASRAAALPAPIAPVAPAARQVALDLRVDMGEQLRVARPRPRRRACAASCT